MPNLTAEQSDVSLKGWFDFLSPKTRRIAPFEAQGSINYLQFMLYIESDG